MIPSDNEPDVWEETATGTGEIVRISDARSLRLVAHVEPEHAIRFCGPAGRVIFAIKPDGNVELGEGVMLDEASAHFWKYIADHKP